MLTIKMRSLIKAQKELRSVGVGTRVGHGEDTGTVMLVDEVLIGELGTIDGETTGSISSGEVTTLCHKVRDDSMEGRALVGVSLIVISSTEKLKLGALDEPTVEY